MSGRLPHQHQDQELSALIDGELSPERERALRARVAEDPGLAARLSELERVDVALRAMPRALLSPQRQQKLQQQLRARIASGGQVRRLHRRRALLWAPSAVWATAALAAAAALAIYLALPGPGFRDGSAPEVAVQAELETVSDEEIGIVLDYDMLADLEVIEDLELLELMIELEEQAERG